MRRSLLIGICLSMAACLVAPGFGAEIHDAAAQGDQERVRQLLQQDPQLVNAPNQRGHTPLHLAANGGHVAVMTVLLDAGADSNAPDSDGDTPLHWAAYAGQDGALQLLLERRVDRHRRNKLGWTALAWAAAEGHASAVKLLIAAGLEVSTQYEDGSTPLHRAAAGGHGDVVKLLLAHGAQVAIRDARKDSPLHAAAWNGDREVVELLLAAGADAGVSNDAGVTPLANAMHAGHSDIVALMRKPGATPGEGPEPVPGIVADQGKTGERTSIGNVRLTVLYDNSVYAEDTGSAWGFSCLIEGAEKTMLFDTGGLPEILVSNAEALHKDLSEVDLVVISHMHGDHTGGLFKVLELAPGVPVYVPRLFAYDFVRRLRGAGATVIPVGEPVEICAGVHLTGELGDEIKELSLVLDTTEGLVVVTGCSHPGIDRIIERATEIVDGPVHLAVGGFHLLRHSEAQLHELLAKLEAAPVERWSATHCTGDEAIALFKKVFKDRYLPAGTGRVFRIGQGAPDPGSERGTVEPQPRGSE